MSAELFSLDGRVAVVTGGTGAIGSALARGLTAAGARVAVVARTQERLDRTVADVGGETLGLRADVLDEAALTDVRDAVINRFGTVDILVNCAGGNVVDATLPEDRSPFEISIDAYRQVVDLNLLGTLLPSQIFGAAMGEGAGGSIITISSLAAGRAVTRVGGYGAAKAAVESITRWLAVELGRRGTGIRVNAVVPGFFVGDQNRALLLGEDGEPTARGRTIVERTPLARFGDPAELVSTVIWLAAPSSRFVTGVCVPVDGGFSAFTGV